MTKSKFILVAACAALFVLWRAAVTQEATKLVDRDTRPLGELVRSPQTAGPIYFENDSYYWLLMAERMRDEGVFRVRWTESDNAPFGRPVYWSQSIAWIMCLLSYAPCFSGSSDALVAASFWVNPLIEIVTLSLLIWLLSPFGLPMVALTVILFLGLGDVSWAFSSLRPDHQSLQAAVSALLAAALLRVGFGFGLPSMNVRAGATEDARRYQQTWPYIFAGACVGVGFWVSAAATMPLVVVLAASVSVALLAFANSGAQAAARGWLSFGISAAAVSMFFWLVEFFPAVGATRLEINNPAFSFWVFSVGVVLAAAFRLRNSGRDGRGITMFWIVVAGFLCVLLPAIILFGPVEWYQPRNMWMDRFHNFIMEFYTFRNFTKGNVLWSLFLNFQLVLPLAWVLLVPAFIAREARTRAALLVLLLFAAALFLMSMRQIRWLAVFAPVLAIAAAGSATWLCSLLWNRGTKPRIAALLLFLLVAAQGVFLARGQMKSFYDVLEGRAVLNELMPAVLNKRFATSLAASPDKPTLIMADPNLAPAIAYFARIPVVVSFYWENLDGVRDAAIFFSDSGEADAVEVAKRRKISHVVVPSGEIFPNYFDFMKHGHYDTERAKGTLAHRLTEGSALSLPNWLEVDEELDRIGKAPYVYRGEPLEQYLNVYRVNAQGFPNEKGQP
jgi:hypothetical protein